MCENDVKKKAVGAAMLLSASFIWGTAFVAQAIGMDYVEPFTFSTVRCLLAAAVLFVAALIFDKTGKRTHNRAEDPRLWKYGILLGVILFFAVNLQQWGITGTTAAKAGFITSLYIVLVPVFGVFIKQRVHPVIWVCVCLALIGLYFLSIQDGFTIGLGDFLTLLCAIAFAAHILVVGKIADKVDCVRLSCIQFLTVGLLSAPLMFLLEQPDIRAIGQAWMPISYAGVLSAGVAYTLQILGQQRLEPATASLMMSPEAVFAAIGGWVLLGQGLNDRELLGCGLVFAAVVISQIPFKPIKLKKTNKTEG